MSTDEITYSSYIYSTPDDWGNVTEYHDREDMLQTIESLKELGDDWSDISLKDCTEYRLVETFGPGAIYEELHRRDTAYLAIRMGGDMEPIVEYFGHDLTEARESLDEFLVLYADLPVS